MSDYKERAIERRDFRSVKAAPETPKPKPSKKLKFPFELQYRYTEIEWKKRLTTEHWWILKEFRENNNAWLKFQKYSTRSGAEQSLKQKGSCPYYGATYEFRIVEVK